MRANIGECRDVAVLVAEEHEFVAQHGPEQRLAPNFLLGQRGIPVFAQAEGGNETADVCCLVRVGRLRSGLLRGNHPLRLAGRELPFHAAFEDPNQ